MSNDPYPYEPLDATPAVNLDILDNPFVDAYLSYYHPELLPGRSNMRDAHPSLATVAISKSEDTSHTHDCRFPDTFLTAARSRPLPIDLVGHVDETLWLSTMVQPFLWDAIVPVAAPATRPSGPSRTRPPKNHPSPYSRGKDKSQNLSSRPSDVEHTAKKATGGCSGRYLILSFPSPGTECDQDCTRRAKVLPQEN